MIKKKYKGSCLRILKIPIDLLNASYKLPKSKLKILHKNKYKESDIDKIKMHNGRKIEVNGDRKDPDEKDIGITIDHILVLAYSYHFREYKVNCSEIAKFIGYSTHTDKKGSERVDKDGIKAVKKCFEDLCCKRALVINDSINVGVQLIHEFNLSKRCIEYKINSIVYDGIGSSGRRYMKASIEDIRYVMSKYRRNTSRAKKKPGWPITLFFYLKNIQAIQKERIFRPKFSTLLHVIGKFEVATRRRETKVYFKDIKDFFCDLNKNTNMFSSISVIEEEKRFEIEFSGTGNHKVKSNHATNSTCIKGDSLVDQDASDSSASLLDCERTVGEITCI